jgi:hypothetical protein
MIHEVNRESKNLEIFVPPSVKGLVPIILPTEEQTMFLRACLHQGEAGRDAYKFWRQMVDDPIMYFRNDAAGTKRLLPLFYDTVKRNRLVVEKQFLIYLRAAGFTEEIRFGAYREACGEVLDILNRTGIVYLVLKGAAYAEVLYRIPCLRHSDDLDLLVCEKDLFRATKVLLKAGLKPYSYPLDVGTHHLAKIIHKSGLSVELHRRLYDPYCYYFPFEDLWLKSQPARVAGRESRVLGPVDSLVNILTHATLCRSQRSLRWVCDAWLLVSNCPEFDWHQFVDTVFYSKTELPTSYTLTYMADKLQLPVPDWVLAVLCKKTHQASFKQRCAFIYGVRNNYPKEFSAILHMPGGIGLRLRQLLWLYFPFLLILPLTGGMRIPALAPFYYLLRVSKIIMRRLMKRNLPSSENTPHMQSEQLRADQIRQWLEHTPASI